MNFLKKLTYLFIAVLILASCSNDDDSGDPVLPLGDYENGILISNEGPFGTGTGTVSFISEDNSTNEGSIFQNVNESELGNIVQSIGFSSDNAYIVVNNSHKVHVVNRYTFELITTIDTGLINPRNFVAVENSGYVTNWGDPFDESDDFVAVIDLTTNTIVETISVDFGPEKLVTDRNNVYVAHQGGFSQNNKITIIDTSNNTVNSTVDVGDVPNSMVLVDNDLWILCGGNPSFATTETKGSLVKLDLNSNNLIQSFDFNTTDHPSSLTIDGSNLLYNLNGSVFSVDANAPSIPTTSILDGFFYTMTANGGKLYTTDAGDFASNGTLKVFDLSTNTEVESYTVGIIPGGIYFN
ncbi:MAG: YncE family protein [Flavobacteriaceae bacterium]|nr:YncE family protein [Flavobacteriaceae bacterium]